MSRALRRLQPLLLGAVLGGATISPPDLSPSQVIPVRSLDPGDNDYSDLDPLIELIGDARVVQLAEATHGEGSSVLARSRVIAFLYERLGFDVVAFESPFFEMRDVDRALRSGADLSVALRQGLYDVWGQTNEILPLFNLIRASKDSDRPITVAGADSQLFDARSPKRIHSGILGFLSADPEALSVQESDAFLELVDHLRDDNHVAIDADKFVEGLLLLGRIHYLIATPSLQLRNRTTPLERDWWVRVIATVKHGWEDKYLSGLAPSFNGSNLDAIASHPMFHAASNRRDRAMAENINWIANVAFPGHRIIVWGATSHLQETGAGWAPGNAEYGPVRVYTTGEMLAGNFGDDLFTMITTAYQGEYASPSTRTAMGEFVWHAWQEAPAVEGTCEYALHALGLDALIVDTRILPRDLRLPRGLLEGGPSSKSVRDSCDAILFVDSMRPPTPAVTSPGAHGSHSDFED